MPTVSRVRTNMVGVDGGPYYSNMFFDALADPQDMVDKVGDFWAGVAGFMTDALSYNVEDVVTNIDVASGEAIGAVTVNGITGQGISDVELMPPANQFLFRWRTGHYVGGRELRGKTFIPGLTQSANDGGFISDIYLTDSTTFIATWLATTPALVIYSRTHSTFSAVTSGSPWSEFAVLRSRRD